METGCNGMPSCRWRGAHAEGKRLTTKCGKSTPAARLASGHSLSLQAVSSRCAQQCSSGSGRPASISWLLVPSSEMSCPCGTVHKCAVTQQRVRPGQALRVGHTWTGEREIHRAAPSQANTNPGKQSSATATLSFPPSEPSSHLVVVGGDAKHVRVVAAQPLHRDARARHHLGARACARDARRGKMPLCSSCVQPRRGCAGR